MKLEVDFNKKALKLTDKDFVGAKYVGKDEDGKPKEMISGETREYPFSSLQSFKLWRNPGESKLARLKIVWFPGTLSPYNRHGVKGGNTEIYKVEYAGYKESPGFKMWYNLRMKNPEVRLLKSKTNNKTKELENVYVEVSETK